MKISVSTATWNCVETAGGCLASVAGQSFAEREHILIDGGSTDGTLAVIQAHRLQPAVLVSEPDGGIYEALNKGIARASGDVVGLLHADDRYADTEVLARIGLGHKPGHRAIGTVVGPHSGLYRSRCYPRVRCADRPRLAGTMIKAHGLPRPLPIRRWMRCMAIWCMWPRRIPGG